MIQIIKAKISNCKLGLENVEKFIHNIAMGVEIQRQPTKMKELPYLTSEYNYKRINFAKNRMQECRTFGSGENKMSNT